MGSASLGVLGGPVFGAALLPQRVLLLLLSPQFRFNRPV